jgi:hypothetical protein
MKLLHFIGILLNYAKRLKKWKLKKEFGKSAEVASIESTSIVNMVGP